MAEEDILFGKKRHLFGGIEPSNMIKFSTISYDNGVVIEAMLPKDTVVDGQTLCTVAGAVIRRKIGGYPVDEFDGEEVMSIAESGTYKDTNVLPSDTYYYAAFPYTTQGVYNRNPANRSIYAPVGSYYLFGYDLDTADPDPATRISYPSDVMNANYTPVSNDLSNPSSPSFNYGSWTFAPGEYFMPRPCMLKYDGTVDHYLEPSDYAKKYDLSGSSRVSDMSFNGNAMMEWPKIYTYREETNGVYKFRCSNVKHGPKWDCWCNYDKNDNEIDKFYTSIYRTSLVDGTTILRSISGGKDPVITTEQAIEYANNNGEDWSLETIAERLLINDLLVMIGKNTNTQSIFGSGRVGSGVGANVIGINDGNGMFYGGGSSLSVKVFGIEGMWGDKPRVYAGLISDAGIYKLKITRGRHDGSVTDDFNDTGSGFIELDSVNTLGSCFIRQMLFTPFGRIPGYNDSTVVGSSTTYDCDKSSFTTSLTMPSIGGLCNKSDSSENGCFAFNFVGTTGISNNYGFGLSCKPSKK